MSSSNTNQSSRPAYLWSSNGSNPVGAVIYTGGKLKIEFSETEASAYGIDVQTTQKELYNSSYKSGQLSSWNKFCFTGGYIEFALKLPGDFDTYGLWPAIWLLGNLGKAGYVNSTSGAICLKSIERECRRNLETLNSSMCAHPLDGG